MVLNLFGKKEETVDESNDEDTKPEGKYTEQCSVCGKAPCDKFWGGQYFHKKCFRKMKKMAKGML
ncbi:MAG: hypothetical protein PHQ98_01960 [Candidatus ainarchaeum sp.]|nr:hypothetical protein [Candidatus ainarchaeum sp.]